MDEEEALKKARNMVLRLLSYRARSKKELADYLEKKGFSEKLARRIIKEMEKFGYINDEKFAVDYIETQKARGYGIKKVRYELYLKGISERIIEQIISDFFDPEEDLERIKALLRRRSSKNTGFNITSEPEEKKQRRFRREANFLQRRGFQDDLIMKALKNCNFIE